MNNYGIEAPLDAASARGVSVRAVMTESPSDLSELTALAQHGLHVILLSTSKVYIHAKVICADCSATSGTAFLGNENFSASSLDYNRELGAITRSTVAIRAIGAALDVDAAAGTPLSP
jgi:phosphatidylserine/phosphatidylglycerophosphate/cardiolipin synthase-like enzyme